MFLSKIHLESRTSSLTFFIYFQACTFLTTKYFNTVDHERRTEEFYVHLSHRVARVDYFHLLLRHIENVQYTVSPGEAHFFWRGCDRNVSLSWKCEILCKLSAASSQLKLFTMIRASASARKSQFTALLHYNIHDWIISSDLGSVFSDFWFPDECWP